MLLQKLATTRPKLATTRLDMSVTAPTSDYWRDFSEEPEDFDAEKVGTTPPSMSRRKEALAGGVRGA